MNAPFGEIPSRLMPVARLVGQGKENDEIARALNLAPHTIENYVSELKDILEAHGRVDLAFKCIGIDS